jgi:hypothetical protein
MSSDAPLSRRIKALKLPPTANDHTRALYSNLKRHGARMPAAQAEKLIALIEEATSPRYLSEPVSPALPQG